MRIIAASLLLLVSASFADDEWTTGIGQTDALTKGLVGYWSMRTDGAATQVVAEVGSSPMNAGAYGQPNLATSGVVGVGCSFVGTLLGSAEGLKTADQFTNAAPFSAFTWARLRSGGAVCIMSTYSAASIGWTLDATTSVGQAHVRFSNGTGTNNFLRTFGAHGLGTLSGQWAMWGVVADANTLTLYCNGVAMTSVSQNVMLHTNALILGWRPDTTGDLDNYGGMFDETRLWNRALSSEEAMRVYQAGKWLQHVK